VILARDAISLYLRVFPVSPLAIDSASFSRITTVVDESLVTSDSIFAVHPSAANSTVFVDGKSIGAYLKAFETADAKLHTVDFHALKAEAATTSGPAQYVYCNLALLLTTNLMLHNR
jgi:hypothetical protein